jgi:hypothetical protein
VNVRCTIAAAELELGTGGSRSLQVGKVREAKIVGDDAGQEVGLVVASLTLTISMHGNVADDLGSDTG